MQLILSEEVCQPIRSFTFSQPRSNTKLCNKTKMRAFGLVIAILMSMLCEITKCFQIIKVASKRQDQNYSSKFYSSTQNQETEKRQRRSIQIPTSGNKATLISRTVPVTAEYSLTVWEWENPAQVMESYWEAVQYANDDCFLTGSFKSPSSQQLLIMVSSC